MSKSDELSINLNMLDEKGGYKAFHVEGNEAEVLTSSFSLSSNPCVLFMAFASLSL